MPEATTTTQDLIDDLEGQQGEERLTTLLRIVNSLFRRKPSEAYEYALQGEALARELGNRVQLSHFLNRLGITQHFQGKFGPAVEYYQASLGIAKELGSQDEVAKNMNNIAAITTMQGDYAKALDLQSEIRAIYTSLNDKHGLAACLNNTGNIYLKLGAYEKCLQFYLEALRIREEIEEKEGIISCCANIGSYLKEEEPKRALGYLDRALELIEETGEHRMRGFVLAQHGMTLHLSGQHEAGETELKQSVEVMKETENLYDLAMAYVYLCNVYNKREDYDEALRYNDLALEVSREAEMIDFTARELVTRANIRLAQGRQAEAQEALDEAKTLAEKLDVSRLKMHCHELQAVIHAQRGDYQQAYETLQMFSEYREETVKMEADQRARELEVIYAVEKNEREAELMRQKNTELAQMNEQLRRANQALQAAQDNLQTSERKVTALAMAVTANHQINQPLMVAQGSAELLRMSMDAVTQRQAEHFEKIFSSIARIQTILGKYCSVENVDFEDYVSDTQMVSIT